MKKQPAPTPTSPANTYSPESWKEARRIVETVGKVPSSFTSCIHFLKKDIEENGGALSSGSRFALGRLMKSDIFRAPLFYGATTFYDDAIDSYPEFNVTVLSELFGADGILFATAVLYLYRRTQHGADKTEWEFIAKQINVESELGALVGRAIPAIGFSLGLLVGSIRTIGCSVYLGLDKKGYQAYRRKAGNKSPYDMQHELNTWGCNHAQIAALLLQTVGIGVSQCDPLILGLDPSVTSNDNMQTEGLKVRLASLWIEALRTTGKPPDMTHNSKFYPLKDDLARLLEKAGEIRKEGSKHSWLDKGKGDVSHEKTPQLYSQYELKKHLASIAEKAEQAQILPEEQTEEEVPEEIKRQFSDEDLAALESDEF